MDTSDLDVAAEFCRLVETADLFEYLGLPKDASSDEAQAALAKKRRYMQGMQGNPKFRDSARFLIKSYRVLERVLEDAQAHFDRAQREREDAKLPMLTLALDGMMTDGVVTKEGEAFIRKTALELGVSLERYLDLLADRADAHGAVVMTEDLPPGPTVDGLALGVDMPTDHGTPKTVLRGAAGHAWWDQHFTRMLLETIPGGPGEMVDVYCRTALSALTLLPERRQLTYLGIDRSQERIEAARDEIAGQALQHAAARITLAVGEPHKLPIKDESVDFVMAIRALANLYDTRPVFQEAVRVLRPGGRLIVAEPDGMGESFYFDGHLLDYNAAFHRLCDAVDQARAPDVPSLGRPGLSIGPTIAPRMAAVGLSDIEVRVHAAANMRRRRFGRFAKRLRSYASAQARSAGLHESFRLEDVMSTVRALDGRYDADHRALSGNVLPMFLVVGVKEFTRN